MAINRIDGLTTQVSQLLNKSQDADSTGSDGSQRTENRTGIESDSREISADKAEISPQAHRLNALRQAMEAGRSALEAVPEVRPDRVAQVRSRLNHGFYNSLEVRTRIAERFESLARSLENI